MNCLESRLKHYQKSLKIQSNEMSQQCLLACLYQFVNHSIALGDIEQSKRYIEGILEIKPHPKQLKMDKARVARLFLSNRVVDWFRTNIHRSGTIKLKDLDRQALKVWIDYYRSGINTSNTHFFEAKTLGHLLTYNNQFLEGCQYYRLASYIQNEQKYFELGYSSPELLEQFQSKVVPNFIVVGVGKGGSSSLYRWIVQHPLILSALDKEVHFFQTAQYQFGQEWYQNQFPIVPQDSSFITGEATPWYYASFDVARKIKEYNPNIKLIIALRNPCDRAVSHYKLNCQLGRESRRLEVVISSERKYLNPLHNIYFPHENYWQYEHGHLLFGLYAYFLESWLNYFAREQLLIVKSEDLFQKPEPTLNRIFQFLGLPEYRLPEYVNYNPGRYASVDDRIYKRLSDFYRPHNQRLEEMLGMKFDWDS
jgi:hypothetical protein